MPFETKSSSRPGSRVELPDSAEKIVKHEFSSLKKPKKILKSNKDSDDDNRTNDFEQTG